MNTLNSYTIKISGLNLHYVLDFFERENVSATKIKRPNQKTLICTLDQNAYKFFTTHPISKAYQIKIIKQTGLNQALKFTAMHLGLFFGVLICLLPILSYTRKIQQVIYKNANHICQNDNQCIFHGENFANLKQRLEELGIKNGKPLPSKNNLRNIEKQLICDFDQISGATINVKGVYVLIDIVEAKLPEFETATDLVSPVSGIIISNYVTSGNPKDKNGDIVMKGQKLVEAVDNSKIVAKFEIRTFYHESLIYDENQTKYKKTGKQQTINSLSLFGITLKNDSKPKYTLYQTQNKTTYPFLNMFLPIKNQSITYFELEEIKENIPFETVENQLKEDLYLKTKQLLNSNSSERNTTFASIKEGSRTRLDCYIEAIYTLDLN